MRQTADALVKFLKSFDLPVYARETVPEDQQLPYITFPLVEPEWNQKATFYIQGWYRTTDYSDLLAKCDEIIGEIGTGITIGDESGYIVIYPETPLVQIIVNGDIRSFYINLSLNAYHMPGVYPEEGA